MGFSKREIDLNTVDKITDTVRHTGIEAFSGSRINAMVFALYPDQLTAYTLYRANGNYDDLLLKIKPGDVVTIYYRQGVGFGRKDIVQLEHNGVLIIGKSEYENKSEVATYMILALAVFFLGGACVLFRQFRKVAGW